MSALLPFLRLWRRHGLLLSLGLLLAIVTLLASISLLTLSGWFLAASALAGTAGLYSFNYMLPAAGVRGAAIIRTAARYFERLVSHDGTFRVLQHLRVYTFSKLFPLSPAGLAEFRQGDLLNRFVADVDNLDHLYLRVLSPLAGALLVIIAVTFGLSFLSLPLALITGGIMLLSLLLLPILFYRLGVSSGQQVTALSAAYRLQLTRWLSSMAELKIYQHDKHWQQQLSQTGQNLADAKQQQHSLNAASQSVLMIITGITVCMILWLGSLWLNSPGQDPTFIALFAFCALAAFESLGPVAASFLHISRVVLSARRLTELLDKPPQVIFPAQSTASQTTGIALKVTDLSFAYPGQQQLVLDGLNLQVSCGEKIALLGFTGCGKSTLLQLLTRAADPLQGNICFNQLPLKEWDETSLRQRTSVVTQRVALFNQTLRDNLRLAADNSSDSELIAVLQLTGLDALLENEGLDSWMGEGGRTLSGGELRRLAIARALLHQGDLWLLDEPTEGLDASTEQQILELLQRVTQGKTVIMVTHRLNGLDKMDRICVMENGGIIEQGSHQQLLKLHGRYRQFCQRLTGE
ncbi:heme ABC transporter ATP-binding protein/permease CydC [Tatumella citrea]|uniref:Glutathione/L-cysteine transport system ATP-binding/permease protein CydC n=1 Tax=Tatumella citrea TaxID=53336 RepID=A0A1Y0L650_TATCI|nr:cysteine/glutathione ABC transporter ATP-binding protein/permease CydC [Tatumella citrea]ARU93501.1 cysteine/glutathione ABC transporter ATP-binding protein/permease CydC [Tatumella citrea]ARU97540.1 cysteine/glutathione ABC transporter ATP-binding protein/permease CydC [Tatumella citrea]